MSKIAFFGDLHITKDEIRILECLNFLEYLKNYCLENNIKNIVNLGDTFNYASGIKNEMFVPVFMKFMDIAKAGIHIYTICGNHDAQNKDNDCLAETFGAFGTFIKNHETINIEGIDYDFLSYTKDVTEIPKAAPYLFGHLEVTGFWFNPGKKIDGGPMNRDNFQSYSQVISGHLHHFQQDDKFTFIGTPYETDKGEAGKSNFFGVIEDGVVTTVSYEEAPKYVTISAEDSLAEDADFTNKMVTVLVDKKIENFVKLRNILMTSKGAISVEPQFIKPEDHEMQIDENQITADDGVLTTITKYFSNDESNKEIDKDKVKDYLKILLESLKVIVSE